MHNLLEKLMFSKKDRTKEICSNNPVLTPSTEKHIEGVGKGEDEAYKGQRSKTKSPLQTLTELVTG